MSDPQKPKQDKNFPVIPKERKGQSPRPKETGKPAPKTTK